MDQGFPTNQVPGPAFHRAGTVRDPRRCHQTHVLPREKTLLVGITERESLGREINGGEAAPGPEEDAGLGPIPARRIIAPPSPGAAVMSWHREGAAGSRALEQVALARFLPPAGAPKRGRAGVRRHYRGDPPPAAPSAASTPDFTPPYLR